jgi:methylmalonyl-CoA/ethylmalonyl-CoA epimerase
MSARAGESVSLGPIAGRVVGQVGIVVRDLTVALERYSNVWGLGPWQCWRMDAQMVPERGFRGGEGKYEMRVALYGANPQVELLEPLQGPSIYHEWLDKHEEGLHHLGFHVPSIGDAMNAMSSAGYEAMQWGRGYGAGGDGGFAYYDASALLGLCIELIEVPEQRIAPEFVYPLTTTIDARRGSPESS